MTNGDQTDTIYELMDKQQTFEQALRTREFEPDAPNYTPRISGIMHIENGKSANSIYIAPKFRQVEYDITTGDNVTVNGQNRTTARGGEQLTFTANPPAGQTVTGWTVNGKAVAGNGNTLTWTVENGCLTKPNVTAYHVEAQFSAGEYEVTYSQPANGTLTASVESGTQVNGGTKVAFTAEPDKGYEIDEWMVNGHSVANSGSTYTLNVTENSTVAVDRKSTRLNSSHTDISRMPSSA